MHRLNCGFMSLSHQQCVTKVCGESPMTCELYHNKVETKFNLY